MAKTLACVMKFFNMRFLSYCLGAIKTNENGIPKFKQKQISNEKQARKNESVRVMLPGWEMARRHTPRSQIQ